VPLCYPLGLRLLVIETKQSRVGCDEQGLIGRVDPEPVYVHRARIEVGASFPFIAVNRGEHRGD